MDHISEDSAKSVSGWSVRGAIQNSLKHCYLQQLAIEGAVRICGVVLNQNDLDDLFARFLLENWAILHSERIDKLRPRNRDIPTGIHQGTKDFHRLKKEATEKAGRLGMDSESGWPETL
jgi:hypothetical protein